MLPFVSVQPKSHEYAFVAPAAVLLVDENVAMRPTGEKKLSSEGVSPLSKNRLPVTTCPFTGEGRSCRRPPPMSAS